MPAPARSRWPARSSASGAMCSLLADARMSRSDRGRHVCSMGAKTAAHLPKCDTVLGALQAELSCTGEAIAIEGKEFERVNGRLRWCDV